MEMGSVLTILFVIVTWICRQAIWIIIGYGRHAIPGLIKVLWYPRYAPMALTLMLASAADAKYGNINFGKYNPEIHLVIMISPLIYFYLLGKHRVSASTTVVKERVIVSDPIKYSPQPTGRRIVNPPKEYINQPEPHATNQPEFRHAKEVDYIEIEVDKGGF